ncbi:hypothetical protein KR026_004706, partial [Drosophila bipectinata]
VVMVWFIVLLLCLGRARAHFPEIPDSTQVEDELLNFLLRLKHEETYNTVLVYGKDCIFHSLARRLEVATVLVSSGGTEFDWDFSSLALVLSCGFEAEKEENYRTLMKLQRNKRLIYTEEDIQPESVCNSYALKDQYNVAIINVKPNHSIVLNACRWFKDPNYEEIDLNSPKLVFINQFRNMHGAPIRTLPDRLAPRSMTYRDPTTNETKAIGYVANLVNNFVQKVNATMVMDLDDLKDAVFYGNISKWTQEDLLDVGMSLDTTWRKVNLDTYTYPYVGCTYCFMVPLPQRVPYSDIYTEIMDSLVLGVILLLFCIFSLLLIYSQRKSWRGLSLANLLLNDKCLRGFLGQPFPFSLNSNRQLKLIFSLLCFASLMTTTMYQAYLQSFMTTPPPEPMLESFWDVDHSRYKIALSKVELDMVKMTEGHTMKILHQDRLQVFEEFNQFIKLRESFNADYIFPVTDIRWETYREQQKLFERPVFYYSDAFCLTRFSFLVLPIRRYLPYRDLLEDHILAQKEFGLLRHWIERSFYDMVKLGLTPLQDLSIPEEDDDPIDLNDLKWIFALYFGGLALGCIGFVME